MWKITRRFLSLALVTVVVLGCISMFTACNKNPVYTITYELDGGTNHVDNPDSFTKDDLPLTIKVPTKEGHEFVGWSCTQLGYLERYDDAIVHLGTAENLTFTAVWKLETVLAAGEYKITYRNLSGADNSANPDKFKELPLTIQAISRGAEFEFLGWTSELNSQPNVTVEIPVNTTRNLIFTANWNRIKAPANYGDDKRKATDFTAYTLSGEEVKLSDYIGKKPVFISFWEYSCTYCKDEMRDVFNPIYEEMKDKFELLAIHSNNRDELNKHLNTAQGKSYKFTILDDQSNNAINPPGSNSSTRYKTGGFPANYMVDKWGYLYSDKYDNPTGAVTSYGLGTIFSMDTMRAIIDAAIARGEV